MENKLEVPQVEQKEDEPRSSTIYFIRHSKAKYSTYNEKVMSDDPEGPVDYDNQIENDADIDFAKEKAQEFFNNLNPEKDTIFVVSSDEMRALETAKVYIDEAEKRDFEIIYHEKTNSETAKKMGDRKIRKINAISLGIKNALLGAVFNPEKYLAEINWNAVSDETKEKWEKAREIINADDKGSWGANFFHHSKEIKKIFPELDDAEETYQKQFLKMVRLAQFAQKKMEESGSEKNMKVLAFGHENYMAYALQKYFGEHEIGNCEAVSFEKDKKSGDLKIGYRGKEKIMGE